LIIFPGDFDVHDRVVCLFILTLHTALAVAAEPPAKAAPPTVKINPQRDAFYGDLHLHTTYSYDAYALLGTKATPEDAYRFARGEPTDYLGQSVVRREPLDFMAVTDHSENIGVFNTLADPASALSKSELGRMLKSGQIKLGAIVNKLVGTTDIAPGVDSKAIAASTWERVIEAANAYYQPGKFTTFIAYEWSAMPGGANLHRNVIFRGSKAPAPFTAIDSARPEDLWSYLDKVRGQGFEALAIPHNSNGSYGLMFDWVNSDGRPIDQSYAQQRALNEPLVEISQVKGTSETHPTLSSADEFSNFEIFDVSLIDQRKSSAGGSYVRDALGRGLSIGGRVDANPFKYGFVGGSDLHGGLSVSAEADYAGDSGSANVGPGRPTKEAAVQLLTKGNGFVPASVILSWKSGSLTGVWAESNTREAIYDAFRRRETFATSGTRLQLRLFGGWRLSASVLQQPDWVKAAYSTAVPMGSDLPVRPADARQPQFVVWAMKDPSGGNLDRVQVVKVWVADGRHHEKVFEVAAAGQRKVDPKTGKLSPVGNTVDVKTAKYSNNIGATVLASMWTDVEFDPQQPAAYYLRVLEIPTPRWPTYLAAEHDLPLPQDFPATIQQRGWSSPIWYTPLAQSSSSR
jgi:hypothetical protein